MTWGGVKVRQIHIYDMDTQRVGKILKENVQGRMWSRELGHMPWENTLLIMFKL